MKKILALISFLAFVIFVTQTAYADNTVDAAKSTKIEYYLAYPEILPDHPFYEIKVLRDKIYSYLINDPKKKIEFYLLQADKGILASAMLIDKKRIPLAEETILKAENNYTLITYQLWRVHEKPNPELLKKLKIASLKHQEVISSILKRVPEENKKTFETVLDFSKRNLETVEKLQKKKYYK